MNLQQVTQQIRERKLAIENDDLRASEICRQLLFPEDSQITFGVYKYWFAHKTNNTIWIHSTDLESLGHKNSIKASELAAMIDAEKEVKEPDIRLGWGYFKNINFEWIQKTVKIEDEKAFFSEYYDNYELKQDDWFHIDFYQHPATKEEIEHFMGLHADRLGMKKGVKVDRSRLSKATNTIGNDIVKIDGEILFYNSYNGHFGMNGLSLRDENSQWATVVKEEEQWHPKVGELVEVSDNEISWFERKFLYVIDHEYKFLVEIESKKGVVSYKFCRPIQKEEITIAELAKLAGKDLSKLKIID